MTKKRPDRYGNAKPGSLRYDARKRGVTEAFIRKERALAKGYSVSQSRGHPSKKKGEVGLQFQKDAARWHRIRASKLKETTLAELHEGAAREGVPLSVYWKKVASPNVKKS